MVWTWIVHGRLPEPRIRGRPSGPAERAGLLAACLARAGRLSRLVLGGPPASCWAGSRLPSASCWAALPLPGPTAGWVLPRLLGRRLGSRARRLLARARLPPAEAPGPAPPAAEAAPPERGPCWAALPLAGPTAGWLLPRLLGRRLGSRARRLLARAELLPAEAGCWVTAATPAGSAAGEPCSAAAGAGPASGAAEGGGPRGHLPPRRISILRMERARAIWRGEHQWRRLLGTAWEPQCRQSYKRKRTKCALNQDVGKAELRHVSRKPNQGALEESLEEVGEEEGPSRTPPLPQPPSCTVLLVIRCNVGVPLAPSVHYSLSTPSQPDVVHGRHFPKPRRAVSPPENKKKFSSPTTRKGRFSPDNERKVSLPAPRRAVCPSTTRGGFLVQH